MTSRQFYIMLWITTMSLKVQKLPSIIYDFLGKDGYLILLLYFAVDIVGILLAFFVLKRTNNLKINLENQSPVLKVLCRVLVFGIVIYFLSQSLLLYEAIQNLFEHILFDNLSWYVFGLLLLFTVFYLAYSGIKNIAKNFELYGGLIFVSYVVIAIFGASKADFSAVLPFETVNIKTISSMFVNFNLWFGDFFLILFMGKHAKNIKLKWTLLVYSFAIAFLMLLYVELNGIYGVYTPMKPTLITTITEQSMLGINIGRVDWFLILITEIGTILSCGVSVYFAKKCLNYVFPKAKTGVVLAMLAAALYLLNVFYLVDSYMQIKVLTGYMSYLSAAIKWGTFIVMVLVCLFKNNHKKSQENMELNHEKITLKGGEQVYEK